MRRILFYTLLLSYFMLTSCETFDNYGYPGKVTFDRDGGTKTIDGGNSFYHVEINDYNGNGNAKITDGENDTIIATYDWLSVKYRWCRDKHIILEALPNTTGKKRTLYVYGMVDDRSADIKVVQEK